MQFLIFFAAIVVAGVGQWFNSHPRFPTWVSKLSLALIGVAFYAISEAPKAWSGPPLLEWLDKAWLWACALPGVASMLALNPKLATSKPDN